MHDTADRNIVMICTAARGGMRSVVEGYVRDGLLSKWNILFLDSHVEGGLALRIVTALKAMLHLMGLLIRRKVGLVHCHAAMKTSFWRKSLFSMVAKMTGVPVIFHLHGSEMKAFVEEQPPWLRRITGWILAQQSVVVVLSESWHAYVTSISPRANVVIVPNYVDLPELSDDASPSAINDLIVLFLGLVGKRKGIDVLLPAFRDALRQFPTLRLIIGGNGEVDWARALAINLNIDNRVEFVGWVSGEQKTALLHRAHLFVLPSYNENLPVSLLEAMSWRLPVISTRVGGIPELVRDGVDGLLVNPGDGSALTGALVTLAQNASLRQEMGTAARSHVAGHYAKHLVLPRLEELYRSLLV